MTYKQTLFFIGQSLTINHEEHNKNLIKKQLESKTVNWESLVKLSTAHYVFPAVYYNFKHASLLSYLPNDLVSYMKHIANLNRERNQQIITQAKEINNLLLKNGIKPIFLKGTGSLLDGLYKDIGERMVGDIDFIVSKNEYNKTVEILKKDGYARINKGLIGFHRHYPPLIKENNIAAVEIHSQLLKEKHTSKLNYEIIKKNIQEIDSVHVLSFEDQFCLTTLVHQINDNGYAFKSISLRKAYDTFLLSKKCKTKNAISKYNKKSYEIINCFIAVIDLVFNNVDSFTILDSKKKNSYIKKFNKRLSDPKKDQLKRSFVKKISSVNLLLNLALKSLTKREYSVYVIKKTIEKIKNLF
tara:strand:- start:176 stop:1243 length:1068 start_codon:yes stop_codon:yes gene_type:complete